MDDGLYRVFRRFITLNAYGFDRFLRAYLAEFPPADPTWRERLRTGLKSRLLAAFHEEAVNLHARLMMDGLAGKAVSLTTLAKELCSEANQNFGRVRARVAKNYLPAMHDLMIWEVVEERRPHRDGAGETTSYQIKPGEAARHY